MTTLTPICSIPRFIIQKQQQPRNHKQNFPQFNLITLKPNRISTIQLSSISNQNNSPGLYSAEKFDLTATNVDLVLEDVRPYLISDGGNVDVVSVEDGVISLKLQGACESCPSSTTTMKMGIERVLKEKFGDAVKDIRQVYEQEPAETTVEENAVDAAAIAVTIPLRRLPKPQCYGRNCNCRAVNNHLEILRPAIKNYGGSVEVLSIEGRECHVKYVGPDSIGSGVKAAIKEKFPDILNVTFSA